MLKEKLPPEADIRLIEDERKATIIDSLRGLPYYPYYLLEGEPDVGWDFIDGGPTVEGMKTSRDTRENDLGWHAQPELGATSNVCHIIVDAAGNPAP